jgi:hypothetical protein
MLFFEEGFVAVKHVFYGQAKNYVVAHYFADFFRRNTLVKVIAWLDNYGWTHGAGANAACSGDFTFFFYAKFFHGFLKSLQHF